MSGNDFDPIRNRVARILKAARPGPGTHLPQEEIDAFAGQRHEPDGAIPEHLRACSWCWSRVYEARRVLARERATAHLRRLRVPIAILERAVLILAPVPGLQPAYAFTGSGMPIMRVMEETTPPAPREETPSAPTSPSQAAAPAPESSLRHMFFMQRLTDSGAVHAIRFSRLPGARIQPAGYPEPRGVQPTVSIPLPVEGFECVLTLTMQGDLCDVALVTRVATTGEPVAGASLMLKSESAEYPATAGDDGIARLAGIPIGSYDLEVGVSPAP